MRHSLPVCEGLGLKYVKRRPSRGGLSATARRVFRGARRPIRTGRLLYDKALAGDYVTSSYGVLLRANWNDATFIFCYFGEYGRFYSDHLASLDSSFQFVDIGANQGLYSLIAEKNENCAGVVAFEPVRETYEILRANVKANGAEGRIETIDAAVSQESGSADMLVPQSHSGRARIERIDWDAESPVEQVRTTTIDEVSQHLVEDVDVVVKVDVEGHEEVVLEQIATWGEVARVVSIFYEMNDDWSDPGRIERILRDVGFTRFEKVGESVTHYDILAQR